MASITTDRLCHKILDKGQDNYNLGRWSWVRYEGKKGRILRIITAYRPTKNTKGSGSNKTYIQQLRYLEKENRGRRPREAFMEDLKNEVEEWRSKGESIIIMCDFNEDVRKDNMEKWRDDLGLCEVMLEGLAGENAPSTFDKGKSPIDSILCSANIGTVKAGYLPFGEGAGDHRPLIIDIEQNSVFGASSNPSSKVKARRLKLKDPRIRKKYQETLKKLYKIHKVVEKVVELNSIPVEYPILPEIARKFEKIDRIRVECMKHAEKKCRKFKTGKIPWSPEVTEKLRIIELWTLVAKRLRGCKVNARTILRKKIAAQYDGETNITYEQACANLTEGYKQYRTVIKDSSERRTTFINDLAFAKAEEGNITASKAIKRMEEGEVQRRSWERIHRMDGSARTGSGLSKIICRNKDNLPEEQIEEGEIVKGCLIENERRFTQSNNTTLRKSPMKEDLGLLGIGEEGDRILEGSYKVPEGVEEVVQDVLNNLKEVDNIKVRKQPIPITCKQHKKGWEKVKERTSSSPSRLHVGHWKCGSMDDLINWVNTSMINIPYLSGYSPKRWQRGINVMLEKIKGNCIVEKLRTILLYEADFNLMNKHVGRHMMSIAEKALILAKEQYGSRKKKSAITHALNKRLTFDILRQQRKGGGICSCDLKSCYDRIIHSFASLAMRRAGVAESATVCMFDTIQKLKHQVRTAFGDSEEFFGGEEWRELEALMGVGQGNGAGPAIWAVISSIFFDTLRKKGYGAILEAPFSKIDVTLAGFGFVDDTDLLQTGLNKDDYWDIATKLQASVELWEKCTEISGGCLVPTKSWWTLIDFTWKDGKWSYSEDMDDVNIAIKDVNGNLVELNQLAANEAQKMLGVWLSPDGNNDKQIVEMRKTTVKWAEKVRTGCIDRRDAWQALTLTVMKKLEYPLQALTLTEKECDFIMAPVLMSGLPKAGICRHTPRALIYGDKEHQGLGLHNLFTTMGINRIQALMDHI